VQCDQTKKFLTLKGIDFESKMIQDSPEIYPLIQEKGYKSAPVVVVGDDSWSGFKLDKLNELLINK
jgi:glutaredoxin-like protein NrdH